MHGFLSEEKMNQILSNAFVGLLPFFENTPLIGGQRTKALQYMASGLLVLSGPEGVGNINYIEPSMHYIDCRTREQFLSMLKKILNRPNDFVNIAKKGRTIVEKKYSWNSTLSGLISLLFE